MVETMFVSFRLLPLTFLSLVSESSISIASWMDRHRMIDSNCAPKPHAGQSASVRKSRPSKISIGLQPATNMKTKSLGENTPADENSRVGEELISCGTNVQAAALSRRGGLMADLLKRNIKLIADKGEHSFKAAMEVDLLIARTAVCGPWIAAHIIGDARSDLRDVVRYLIASIVTMKPRIVMIYQGMKSTRSYALIVTQKKMQVFYIFWKLFCHLFR